MRLSGPMGVKEKNILRAVRDFLETAHIPYIRHHPIKLITKKTETFVAPVPDSQKGAPDLFVFPPRYYFRVRFVAVETKRPGGKQTDDQKKWEAWVNESGGVYYLVGTMDRALEFIKLFNGGPEKKRRFQNNENTQAE